MKQGNNDNGEHFWKAKDVIAVQPCIPEMSVQFIFCKAMYATAFTKRSP